MLQCYAMLSCICCTEIQIITKYGHDPNQGQHKNNEWHQTVNTKCTLITTNLLVEEYMRSIETVPSRKAAFQLYF